MSFYDRMPCGRATKVICDKQSMVKRKFPKLGSENSQEATSKQMFDGGSSLTDKDESLL